MKRIKHSKFKNTGLIFELLVRQVASDTMNNNNSKALSVIKKHFNSKTELSKELKLYRSMTIEKFVNERRAEKFVDAVLRARKEINESQLRRDKYNLIKELKSTFKIEDFFKSRVTNYKLQASIYKLFEYAEADDPKEYVSSKFNLIEHIQNNPTKKINESSLTKEHKDVRILASKIVVDRFNEKYSNLSPEQKRILREYINNVTNSVSLKEFIQKEIPVIQKALTRATTRVGSKIVKIKLQEVNNMIHEIGNASIIKDKHVLTILKYHELIKELNKMETK